MGKTARRGSEGVSLRIEPYPEAYINAGTYVRREDEYWSKLEKELYRRTWYGIVDAERNPQTYPKLFCARPVLLFSVMFDKPRLAKADNGADAIVQRKTGIMERKRVPEVINVDAESVPRRDADDPVKRVRAAQCILP